MEFIRTPKVENVRFLYRYPAGSSPPTNGTLYLTATHLIFVDPDRKKETWILHSLIASVEKLPISSIGSPLLMRCKHFLCITFVIPREKEAHDIYQSLIQLSQPASMEDLYCFHFSVPGEDKEAGWNKYKLVDEYKRMGCPNEAWAQSDVNLNYALCETYPSLLFLPKSAPLATITGSAHFRSKGRLPVLTYLFGNKASISRCAQPLSGFNSRCEDDEKLLDAIRETNPNSPLLYVIDTRPKINAMVNKAQGKGYENEIFYENIKFHFFGIENIHVMRGSLQKLIDACELRIPSMSNFLSGIEGSGWLRHVKAILETSVFIANAVKNGISVVVHCSDGWDRTSQTCSIASVILDPYYRTFDGFQVLILKDWLSFGHKFTDRCGHIGGDNKEMAPVFTQFLDVIWQIMQQHPCAFQFNERFLIMINDSVHNVQFGTFVGNCEKDRDGLRLSRRTFSLWSDLEKHRSEYLNPLYEKYDNVLSVSVAPQTIRFWRGLYNRFEGGVHPRDLFEDVLNGKKNHIDVLKDHIAFMEQYLQQIKSRMKKTAETQPEMTKVKKTFGSLDLEDIDRPMKVVEECMQRLELKHQLEQASPTSSSSPSKDSDYDDSSKEYDLNDLTSKDIERPTSLKLNMTNREEQAGAATSCEDEEVFLPSLQQIVQDCSLVSIHWRSFQNIKECCCSTPLEPYSIKLHCSACGNIFCVRCIDKRCTLPCMASKTKRSTCRKCFMEITRSNSIVA